MPSSILPSGMQNSTSSIRPLAKKSMFRALGKRSRRDISVAAACSGLTAMERPSSSFIKISCSEYSGFLTRAMVWPAPIFLATRQARMFSSSDEVAAMRRSALSTPASFCTERLAPFPCMTRTSKTSMRFFRLSRFESMTVMSLFSLESWSASANPTLPSPTMTIFI